QAFHEVCRLMYKTMFIPDTCAWNPPSVHIRLIAVRDEHRPPAANHRFVVMVKKLKPVHVVQIPPNRRVFAVNLEREKGFVASGIPCGLKKSKRAIAEMTMKKTGIINTYFFDLARQLVHSLL